MELTLDTYRRPAALTYKTPNSRRFFTSKARRLIRLARRIHDGRLFIPEIVSLTRDAVRNGWGKLNDLITEVRAARAKQAPAPEAPAQDADPAPLANSLRSAVPASPVPRPYPRIQPQPAPAFLQIPFVFSEQP